MTNIEFRAACEKCELGMRKVAIEMARTSGILSEAREKPSQENKAELFLALHKINTAFIEFLNESGIAYFHNAENPKGELGQFVGELKKSFDEIKKAPF